MWSKGPKPTRAESHRIAESKVGACVCCTILFERGELDRDMAVVLGDFHHFKSGNKRLGHGKGCCLCVWHHRGHPMLGSVPRTRAVYNVSLTDGSRTFHQVYGSDEDLQEKQNRMLAA